MRATPLLVLALSCLASLAHAAPRLPAQPSQPFTPGAVVVVLAPERAAGSAARTAPEARGVALAATLARFGPMRAENLRRATPAAARRAEVLRLTGDSPAFDPVAVARALRQQPGVLGAAPDLHLQLHVAPDDAYFAQQYALSNSAAGIHAQQGWARETGQPGTLIAILDTGVDLGHEDLATKIWTNLGEIPGNGIDDDGDGLADDVHGWDFGNGDADPNPEPIFDPIFGIDEGWHGTYVAALAAAATNNALGIAGVAWGCNILPLKVSDTAGDIALSSLAGAIDFAIAHHASVVNMSLGASDTSAASVFQPLMNELFDANIVCVASAGNDGTDVPTYPAACDSVLAVASTNASNVRSDFSNWGAYVDLCAPGEGMVSAISRNYPYDDTSLLFFELLWGYDDVNPYMLGDGTSFSAPLVSGAAALVRSHAPWMTAAEVSALLVSTGDAKLYDNPIGPKLNLDRALASVTAVDPPPPAVAALELAAPAPNPAARATTLRFTLARPGAARVAILDAAGRRVRLLADGDRAAGPHAVTWDLRDASGRVAPAGLYFATLDAAGARRTRRLVVLP